MRPLPLAAVLVFGALSASCGASFEAPGAGPVALGSSYPAVPSLAHVAAEVRAANGMVFRAVVQGAPEAAPPERVASGAYQVEYPMARVAVTVVDAMGATTPASVVVQGRRGPLRVTDAAGNPVAVTTPDDPALPWRAVPAAGEFVFFVVPGAQGVLWLRWRAEVRDGVASGEGTTDAGPVALAALSLP